MMVVAVDAVPPLDDNTPLSSYCPLLLFHDKRVGQRPRGDDLDILQ